MPYRLRSNAEIEDIARAGRAVWHILELASNRLTPGITTANLDELVRDRCASAGLVPSAWSVAHPESRQPFPGACSISVNDEAAHAPPSDRVLQRGDLVTIDLAASLEGWHADAAVSRVVMSAKGEPEGIESHDPGCVHAELVAAAHQLTQAIIDELSPGGMWSDAVSVAHETAQRLGVCVLPGLGGHGIGRSLHEHPAARFDTVRDGNLDFRLAPGCVFTIEPIVTPTPTRPVFSREHWTIRTENGVSAACEERTVAITECGVRVLTTPEPG